MGLFNFNKKEEDKKEPTKHGFASYSHPTPELPSAIEKNGQDWVSFGHNNLYPQDLNKLVKKSAMQSAIIQTKAKMMSGNYFLFNGVQTEEESNALLESNVQLKDFIGNVNGNYDLIDMREKLADDYQRYGAMAIEVVWSMDWSKIATIKYIPVANVRCGKMVNDKVTCYYYSRDWANTNKCKPIEIKAFDEKNRTDYNQLIYIKNGNLEYYGEPSYESALTWISVDSRLGTFHDSNIRNGFNMGMSITVFGAPADDEKRDEIVSQIKKQYQGEYNAGKVSIFFCDTPDTATQIKPIEVSNLDKQLLQLSDQSVSHILTANRATSPLLFGISTAGQLGGGTELETAYKIFNNSVVAPDRKVLEKLFNKLLKINNIPVTIKLQEFNPLT